MRPLCIQFFGDGAGKELDAQNPDCACPPRFAASTREALGQDDGMAAAAVAIMDRREIKNSQKQEEKRRRRISSRTNLILLKILDSIRAPQERPANWCRANFLDPF